jgi:translation initiation factor IF-2
MGVKANDVIKILMGMGSMVTLNEQLDFDTAQLVAAEFDYEVVNVGFQEEEHLVEAEETSEEVEGDVRPPVVTIMGHVDHGKATLLDAIRGANVVDSEAGGITQHIGAYQVDHNGGLITFIDTPGHEAFTSMRARGANATDIAILVVAADDGIMPQTVESINHVKAADVPLIVAINKCDKPGVNPELVKQRLMEHGLVPEEFGGDTMTVNVSALKRTGLDNLLDAIQLIAEVSEFKAVADRHATGVVLEARLEKGRGAVATVLVKDGTLKKGDPVVFGSVAGKIRAMNSYAGKALTSAGPSTPVEVIGLAAVPRAGDDFVVVKNDKAAKALAAHREDAARDTSGGGKRKMTLEDLMAMGQDNTVENKSLNLVVKADVPLSEMFGYVTSLRTLSSGRATSTMEFSHYAETPSGISDQVIKKAKGIIEV